jgi:hypothetical protein
VGNQARQPPAGGAAAQQDPLVQGLAEVAQNIRAFLRGQGEDGIALGQFTGPPNFPSSGGPGIVKALAEELQKTGVAVKVRSSLGISGTYRALDEKQGLGAGGAAPQVKAPGFDREITTLLLRANVEDATGKRLVEYEQKIDDPVTISRILGLTFDGPPGEPLPPIRDSIEKPEVHVRGSLIRPTAESPYGIEILVRDVGRAQRKPREARVEEGLAFVPLARDEVYAVRLINGANHEAGVALSIDGLSMFAFSENSTARYMIVPPKGSVTVVGWHRSIRESNEFVITSYAKGAVALLGADPAGIGTITATFQACWPKGGRPPSDEPQQPGDNIGIAAVPSHGGTARGTSGLSGTASVPNDSTGLGRGVGTRTNQVQRDVGVLRASISVRYQK